MDCQPNLTAGMEAVSSPTGADDRRSTDPLAAVAFFHIPSSACVVDESGTIVSTNAAWNGFGKRMGSNQPCIGTGANYLTICARAGVEGDPHAAAVHERLEALLGGLLADFTLEYPCVTPTELLWFTVQAAAFVHDGRRWAAVIHTDITDHVSTVAALRRAASELEGAMNDRASTVKRAEQRAALLAQINADGIWDWSPGSGEFFASDRLVEMLDTSRPQSGEAFLGCLHPDDAARVQAMIARNLETGGTFDADVRILRRQEMPVRALLRGNAVPADAGQPARVVGTLTMVGRAGPEPAQARLA